MRRLSPGDAQWNWLSENVFTIIWGKKLAFKFPSWLAGPCFFTPSFDMLPVGMSNDRHQSSRPVITKHCTLLRVQTTGLNSCVLLHRDLRLNTHQISIQCMECDCISLRWIHMLWATSWLSLFILSWILWIHILRSQSSLTFNLWTQRPPATEDGWATLTLRLSESPRGRWSKIHLIILGHSQVTFSTCAGKRPLHPSCHSC